uniref:Sterile alpha motif domain-containing protein 12-like n=1 Tax=Phallusia mammillata TaxID=59560 RepID=A0A6F9DS54_9ASCI|nr:sterile alpha motif domain-containing protein 12-like [Phallusia mammillata]
MSVSSTKSSGSHRRHYSAENHAMKTFHRTGSSGSVLETGLHYRHRNGIASPGSRRRPGSDSDILESRTTGVSLSHQDSLTLAYHQRPSVVVGHSSGTTPNPSQIRQTKPVSVWTQNEVCKWLKKHIPANMAIYAEVFSEHDITGKTLLMLNDVKLKRMGIVEPAHRVTILNEILKLEMKNFMQCFRGLQSAGMFDVQ